MITIEKWWRIGYIRDPPPWVLFTTTFDFDNQRWVYLFFGLLIRVDW